MTDTTITDREHEAGFGDYFALLKPRVMSLVVFTAFVGLLVAPVPVHPISPSPRSSSSRSVRAPRAR
jgi:heme o synthase